MSATFPNLRLWNQVPKSGGVKGFVIGVVLLGLEVHVKDSKPEVLGSLCIQCVRIYVYMQLK